MRLALLASLSLIACVDPDAADLDHESEDGARFEQAYEDATADEGKADNANCSGVRVPDRSGFGKRIALTFDDGPNPATTPKVIDVLHRHRAPAAFFTNGSRYAAPGAAAIAKRIAADPDFLLANHSQGHLDLAGQSLTKVATEIDRTDALIRTAGETPRYFRFPFGSSTCATAELARGRGYIVTGWHIDSADWCYAAGNGYCKPTTFRYVPDELRNDMIGYVLSQVRATNGGIILFHDIHRATADQLDAVLTTLAAEGYTFVRLDDIRAFPKLHGAAPGPTTFIGDRCATDADCGFTAAGQAGRCHAAKFCTVACAGTCPDAPGKAPTFCIASSTTDSGGTCVAKASPLNQLCAALPSTRRSVVSRFTGASGAPVSTADVCAPE